MNRRNLLKLVAASTGLAVLPAWLRAEEISNRRILVLVELQGGNDSLNTFLPAEQLTAYSQLRPQLGLDVDERFKWDEKFYANAALKPLRFSWQDGDMVLVHGLGYPEPNRSHFRGIEIWDTAVSDGYTQAGWLSNVDHQLGGSFIDAMVFGRNPMPVVGGKLRYLQLKNLQQYARQAQLVEAYPQRAGFPSLQKLLQVQNTLHAAAEELIPFIKKVRFGEALYPDSALGQQLSDVAAVIKFDLNIPIYKVELNGFDTHKSQKAVHARLLQQLAEGLQAFREDMINAGLWDRILLMTYSEFGRRAAQNGSGGSDHGTAATHLVMGGTVRGGHVGEPPSLSALFNGDLQYTTDFRSLYYTVSADWLLSSAPKVAGKRWQKLSLFG